VTRCTFCGKSQDDVRVIVTSETSAICDECVFVAFDIIGSKKGYFYQRVAYWMYRAVSMVGYFLTRSLRSRP
jgi:ATP-dependent protease Clp ATPase subunit